MCLVYLYHSPNQEQTRGVKFNKGPEGMALVDGGRTIVTVNEAHLLHDAEATRQDQASDGTLTRVTYYDVASGEAVKEYVLPVGPLYPGAKDRGMSSLLSDEEDNLYVISDNNFSDKQKTLVHHLVVSH